MKQKFFASFFLIFFFSCLGLKVDRVIISTDTNPEYMEFWPIVAKAWKEILGVRPTLAFIASKDVYIDESIGDVIRFEPIEGVSTALQAQVVRLLLPMLFKDEVSLLSDMDMIPVNKSFFVDSIIDLPQDSFVVYKSDAILQHKQYPMCYNAATGKTYKEVFGLDNIENITHEVIAEFIKKVAKKCNHAWSTDQQVLYSYLINWEHFDSRCIRLKNRNGRRIDRSRWGYSLDRIKNGYYEDAHLLRPYSKHKKEIDQLAHDLGLFL